MAGPDSKQGPKQVEKIMSTEDSLSKVDREIQDAFQRCVKLGYTPEEIEKFAHPILSKVDQANRRRLLMRLVKLALIVASITLIFHHDPVYRMVCVHARLASIKLLPYLKWDRIYNWECAVDNPLYEEKSKISLDDCKTICKSLKAIEKISNVNATNMEENYIRADVPVIVTDATEAWPAMKDFNFKNLSKLYSDEPSLSRATMCGFSSSVDINWPKPFFVIDKVEKNRIDNWYMFWENCDMPAIRFIRKFYRRPYFFPAMVEMIEGNWLMVGANYMAEKHVWFALDCVVTWVAQVMGESSITLTPQVPCNKTCTKIHTVLKQGEILVYTNEIWEFTYLPRGNESVALAAGGNFDII